MFLSHIGYDDKEHPLKQKEDSALPRVLRFYTLFVYGLFMIVFLCFGVVLERLDLILTRNRNTRGETLIPRRREDPGVRPEVFLALCLREPTARHPDHGVGAAPVVQSREGAPLREDLEDRAVLEAHGRGDTRPDIGPVGRVVVDTVGLLRGGHFNGWN
jgi:hypothetical protein